MRTLEGQATLQARTSHEIGVDDIHDELVVPNPFAQAILFFRGNAQGNEAPIRVIQGPKTQLSYTDMVTVDPVHSEVFAPQFRTDTILVFRRDVGGDVAPIRIIHGPKTKLDRPETISVDPSNDLLAVTTPKGVWFFNRTDNGDVAPRAILMGPKSRLGGENQEEARVVLYPEGKKIFVTGGLEWRVGGDLENSFLGVWKYGDNGDVPPWAILKSSRTTKFKTGSGLTINPKGKEVIMTAGGALVAYYLPELFQ